MKGNLHRFVKTAIRYLPESARVPAVIVDVGAAGGAHRRWRQLGRDVFVIGFEPDHRAARPERGDVVSEWFSEALSSKRQTATLYVTRWSTNTSLLRPNRSLIDGIYSTPTDFDIIEERTIECVSLDELLKGRAQQPDAVKLDTQGSELYILQGAQRTLEKSVFAVESEVEFVELYEKQPLFGDVDTFLRQKGFLLMDCGNLLFHKRRVNNHTGGRKGQLIAADVLYFRSPEQTAEIVRLGGFGKLWRVILVCLAYGYPDYADEVCAEIEKRQLLAQETVVALRRQLSRQVKWSRLFPNFPGRGRLHRAVQAFADAVAPGKNACWINELGN